MEQASRPWPRALIVAGVALLVVLAIAVSAWAGSSANGAAGGGANGNAPTQFLPVQDDGDRPPQGDGRGPGGRDCPEHDGSGPGSGSGSGTETQPQPQQSQGTSQDL